MNDVFKTGTIVVSNPGKQYTHQLLNALQKYKFNYKFITSVWYKPSRFPFSLIKFFPVLLKNKLHKEFLKRYDENVISDNVIQFSYFELIRELSDKVFGQKFSEQMQYVRDRLHDRYVANRLKGFNASIVIGYEESCLRTFREAKKQGITTVLDLAQIHYQEITVISNQFPMFKKLYKNSSLRKKINAVKDEELKLADYIICLSEWAKDSLIKHGIPEHKVYVANLGFDPLKFEAKINYEVGDKIKLLFVGTITNRKGLDLLLKVAQDLHSIADLTLVGPLADAEDLLNTQNINVTWHPYASHDQLSKLYREADLFVFPSYLDSWAMVVIEAMASGLPVIVSSNTGAKEAINSNCGFISPAGDNKIIMEKIMSLHNNKSLIREMGIEARKQSLLYTWNSYYAKIDNIINDIISNERRK